MPRLFGFLLILLSCNLAAQTNVIPKDWVMSGQAAFDWAQEHVTPILVRRGNDPKELEAVRSRLKLLQDLQVSKELVYSPVPFFHPDDRTIEGYTYYDLVAKRPFIYIYVPRLQTSQKELAKNVFENLVLITFVHEMIHVEQLRSGEFPLRIGQPWNVDGMKEEAAAVGKTILEVVRPWAKQGKALHPNWLHSSNQLALVKDDYKDARWVLAFKGYRK